VAVCVSLLAGCAGSHSNCGAEVHQALTFHPDLTFVQIGTSTSEPLPECDRVLIGQTTLPTAAGLLANSALHLDNEGGLVHLARCYGVRSVVVFGPTPSDYFGYPDNVNVEPVVCGRCWWLTRTWMEACPRHYSTVRCMTEQPPEAVASRALVALQMRTAMDVATVSAVGDS
jgi:ADP-heptose:LPS heptosyltransferase